MDQFLEAAFQPLNVPYTILMVVVLIYWLSVIIGVLDFSFLDFDVDADVDIDIDADADIDVDGDAGAGGMSTFLHFFHFGAVPFMIVFTFLVIFMWFGSILTNYYLANDSWYIALGLFPIFLVVGLFLTKFATVPFVKLFAAMDNQNDIEVVGKVCTLMESVDSQHISHAKVTSQDGMVQMVNVRTTHETTSLPTGSKALIVSYDEDKKCYIVESFDA